MMTSIHQMHFRDSRQMHFIPDNTVHLIVTSPPYPMIEWWDDVFIKLNPSVEPALASDNPFAAFELMHRELDFVWKECLRALADGGIICINIGDAVRTIGSRFQLYPNHSRIISEMQRIGFIQLPDILWRKQTNAPNKFMGSGMLPSGAYVTYEHEYILIFRKGDKRVFSSPDQKALRRASAYFWEERNVWFSDIWTDLKGAAQKFKSKDSTRTRSGAFPFELAYRLICMYSLYNDQVLDPFSGTGTTSAAAIAGCRNSIGVETDDGLQNIIRETLQNAPIIGKKRILQRIQDHEAFVNSKKSQTGYAFKHRSAMHDFDVMTSQEKDITFYFPDKITEESSWKFRVNYLKKLNL